MSFLTELQDRKDYQLNFVIDIDGTKYATHEPDSGLVVPAANRIVQLVGFPPTTIDLKRARQKINLAQIKLVDRDEIFSQAIGADDNALIGKTATISIGVIGTAAGGLFDFSDYLEISKFTIKDIKKRDSLYSIITESALSVGIKPIFDLTANLDAALAVTVTTPIIVNHDAAGFNSAGFIRIDDEYIAYTGATFSAGQTTFTGITRGALESLDAAHSLGTEVSETVEVVGNPIDILLQLLTSAGGGGAFDLLKDGLGIASSLIDTAAFTAIRDTNFPGQSLRYHFENIRDGLQFIEQEILLLNNVRLINNASDTLIGLAILDQADLSVDLEELDVSNTKARPKWRATRNNLQNRVIYKWDWSPGLRRFKKTNVFNDTDSQALFGVKSGPTLEYKGPKSDIGGSAIIIDRSTRWLARFSTPQVEVDVEAIAEKSLINVGDKVRFTSPELPKAGGGLGFSSIVEVLKAARDWDRGITKYNLVFTSYSNFRVGVIAPSETITVVTSQTVATVGDAGLYRVGYTIRLWDTVARVFLADPVNTILSIVGNVITFDTAWVTTLLTTQKFKFAKYDDSSAAQISKFAYIVDSPTGVFADGTTGFQIIL